MPNNKIKSIILASGSYLPKKILTNNDLSKIVDTSDEWITSRTGIKQRHIVEEDEFTSDIAAKAAKDALENANLKPEDIDLIVVGTTTPDRTFPATAVKVQSLLNIPPCPAFDVQAVCAGFVYALSVADNLVKNKLAKRALVIGADCMSKILDWQDRTTCVLFGDGAAAVIIEQQVADNSDSGIIATKLCSDGKSESILYADGGVSTTQKAGYVRMSGKEVYRHAIDKMSSIMQDLLIENDLTINDIDFIIPHQANLRIIESIAKKFNISEDRLVITVDRHANTSAASIPLALDDYIKSSKIKKNSLILVTAFGGGLSWGACLIRI